METPKPPASSELRRPSTRPYTRRKRAATVRDTDGTAEPSEPGEASQPASALAVAEAVATAVAEAVTAVESALPGKSKSKTRSRSRAKTQPATPVAIAAAAVAPAVEPDSLDVSLEAIDLEAALAKLTDVTLEAKRDGQLVDHRVEELDARRAPEPAERHAAPLSLDAQIGAQIDASLDVIETLIDDMLDVTRPIAAPLQATLTQAMTQQIDEPLFTQLPSPRQLPTGAPSDPASPPGLVPRGDSRSLRRGELFALVYRVHCFVVTRHGTVGQLGYWSAVEYPTPASASHAYARGCSHWVSEGFSDYRG